LFTSTIIPTLLPFNVGKPDEPFPHEFMAIILQIRHIQCLNSVNTCVHRNISQFLHVVVSLIIYDHCIEHRG
jgi:hypothetical protein